jgi:pseudouridine 5'-phosphatase
MSRPVVTHAIFDLDGTLLDTEDLYSDAAKLVCSRYQAEYTSELKRAVMGGDTLRGAEYVVRELGLPITPRQYIAEREVELHRMFENTAAMPGASALIAALRERAIPIAIATSGHRAITQLKLARHAFLRDVDALVCGDDPRLQNPKPAPDIFLLAAQDLGARPASCLAFEDSLNGLRAALAAGMRTVALVDPRWGFDPTSFAAAERIVAALDEVELHEFLAP